MVKQRGIIDAKFLIFYLKQKLGLDTLLGEGAGPETAEKGLFLIQTDPQVLHTEGQLLQGAVFHVLQSNRKWKSESELKYNTWQYFFKFLG